MPSLNGAPEGPDRSSAARSLRRAWERALHRPAGPRTLRLVRVVLALQALWVLLSRPDLPALAGWPSTFWSSVEPGQALRFGLGVLPEPLEWSLFALLHLALACAALGLLTRPACFASAALLYHFAPVEELFVGMPHTFFGGLTVPVLGLLVLGFAEAPRATAPASAEYRWPVTLIRLLFSFNYLGAFLAKLRFGGLAWFTGENIRNWALLNGAVSGAPWAMWVAESPVICWSIALGTAVVELFFPLAAVSHRAARVLVPLAFLGHVGIVWTLGIFFPSLPLLLLYLDVDRAEDRSREPHSRSRR